MREVIILNAKDYAEVTGAKDGEVVMVDNPDWKCPDCGSPDRTKSCGQVKSEAGHAKEAS